MIIVIIRAVIVDRDIDVSTIWGVTSDIYHRFKVLEYRYNLGLNSHFYQTPKIGNAFIYTDITKTVTGKFYYDRSYL